MRRNRSLLHRILHRITAMSYETLAVSWIIIVLLFGAIYLVLSALSGQGITPLPDGPLWRRSADALYFSIVTATTVGYGDITPLGISKILAGMEAVFAYGTFAVVITKLLSHRQELTLEEMSRLAFESKFVNTREGLYIVRKDLDAVLRECETRGTLTSHAWDNLTVACMTMQSFIERIPEFYQSETHTFILDARRERLLSEAVHRTLHRLDHLLLALDHAKLTADLPQEARRELEELLRLIGKILPHWQEKSPHNQPEVFITITVLQGSMLERIGGLLPLA